MIVVQNKQPNTLFRISKLFLFNMYIMDLIKTFNSLCTPAQFYLAISTVSIVGMLLQNLGNSSKYCIGTIQAPCPTHNMVYFAIKAVYVLIWTFLLQKLCKNGYKNISWFLVLLPLITMFVLIAIFMLALLQQ
mgnify:CR=1 FL=1